MQRIPFVPAVTLAALSLILSGCGGGGGGAMNPPNNGGGNMQPPAETSPPPPVETSITKPVGTHGGIAVGYGTVKDGVDGATLAGFLTHHLRTDSPYALSSGLLALWGSTPPVVRVASGATAEHIGQVRRAVDIINGALPPDWQMTFDPTPRQENQPFGHGTVWYDGEITVNYKPSGPGGPGGFARTQYGFEPDAFGYTDIVNASRVSIATDNCLPAWHCQALVIHEIGHTLGIGGDDWADIYKLYPNSIMTYAPGQPLQLNGSDYLWPLDRDSFRALYSVVLRDMTSPDEIYAALGEWEDSTIHISGDLSVTGGAVSFGASGRNGFMDAQATGGAVPDTTLADNPALSGSASWDGRLLGLDDDSRSVAGAANLSVNLATLAGNIAFTGLESWEAAPGAIGTGDIWGDGDLAYSITISGNAFKRTGGDDGTLAGRFIGPAHEGMTGTLERQDLAAGFGGARDDE